MHIQVVGAGIKAGVHLTIEAREALGEASKVLSLVSDESWRNDLDLQGYERILSLYRDGARDEENYQAILSKILSDARELGNIAVLVPGNPRLGVSFVQRLQLAQREEGFSLSVIAGISSFDTMINDLERDPIEKGTVLIDANRLLLFGLPIVPELDYLIYHVCSIGTSRTHYGDPKKENAIGLLKDKLLQAFDPDHRAILVGSAESANGDMLHEEVRLEDLERLLPKLKFATTLFVPGKRAKRLNARYLEQLIGSAS